MENTIFKPQIKDYLIAGNPCLFLRTQSIQDTVDLLMASISDIKADCSILTWKSTTGINNSPCTTDLKEAFSYVLKKKSTILILHNVGYFMTGRVIQQCIDAIQYARYNGSHIIFIGSAFELPIELKNLVTIVDCSLPTKEEIKADFIKILKAYRKEISLPKDKTVLSKLIDDAANASVGLDRMGAENALSLSLGITGAININIIQSQKEQEIKKSDVLEFINIDERLPNVGGFKSLKKWLSIRKEAFTTKAREYGLPFPKGILLIGPPGTGKSLAAKAIASYLQLPLIRLDMGSIFSSFVGESENRIRGALKIIDTIKYCVLWIDELEFGMAGSRSDGSLDSGVASRVASTILTWRQETDSACFVVATANDVTAIPPQLLRKGRLDEIWATDLPDYDGRKEIFSIHLTKRKYDPKRFDTVSLANSTKDFAGSDIEACVIDGMFHAFAENKGLETYHIKKAIKDTIPQIKRDNTEIKRIKDLVKRYARSV